MQSSRIRRAMVLATLATAVAGAAVPAAAQQDLSKVEIETVPAGSGVYMLSGAGGNMGVSAGKDGIFLIDDEFAPLTEKIRAAIAKIQPGPIRFLLNTHWHGDHTGGNENFGRAGALIVAHDNVRERLGRDQVIEASGRKIAASPAVALPVVTFNDAVTFHLNGDEIHAFHVAPAHTDGDSVVVFKKANVIHTGDLFFNGFYPFIDLSSGGSVDGMIAGAGRILDLADDQTKLIPGHGPLGAKKDLARYRDMLVQVRDRVAALVAQGKSADEVVAAKPTADLDDPWGKGFLKPEQFVRIVYASLAAKKM